jgi:thymidine phosphorylase
MARVGRMSSGIRSTGGTLDLLKRHISYQQRPSAQHRTARIKPLKKEACAGKSTDLAAST